MPAASLNPQALGAAAPRRRRRKRHREPAISRLGPRVLTGLVGLVCLTAALALAWRHPLGAVPACAGVLLTLLLSRYFWTLWPGWLVGLLPVIGLAPWTGWLMVEEIDLLVLASVAGGYLAISGPHWHRPPSPVPVWRRELRWRRITLLMMMLFAVSTTMSTLHGVVDAGGLSGSLFDGYLEAGAALRAGKPVLWMLLLLPLWQRVARRTPHTLTPALIGGCLLALAAICLGTLQERLAFAGLTNFSSDYRTTAQFWEMHVGGAALDGMLALFTPFALLVALRERRPLRFALVVGLLLAAVYAVLTTFSRGLYLGLALALPLVMLLWVQQEKRLKLGERDPASSWLPGQVIPETLRPSLPPGRAATLLLLLLALGAWAAWQMFPTSGYRGLLALSGAMVLLLAQPPAHAGDHRSRIFSAALGMVLALPVLGLNWLLTVAVDKMAYGLYALSWSLALYLAWQAAKGRRPWNSALGDALRAGAWYACLGSCALVAWNWGGVPAFEGALIPLALLALTWPMTQGGEFGALLKTLSWRARVGAMGAVVLVAAMVAAVGGGDYLTGRMSTAGSDLQNRGEHWSRTLTAMDSEEGWIFGAGAGRFVAVFALNAPQNERTGDYRWSFGTQPHLLLSGGQHVLGNGEQLRITQRLDAVPPGLVLRFKARNAEPLNLVAEVCENHLLYAESCLRQTLTLGESPDGWREHQLTLGGNGELGGNGWPRRDLAFAMAVDTSGGQVMLTEVSLRGADGRELLKNGDFRQELAHWFPTSERHHLPWHAKSILLHVLFEQGVVGLLLAGSLYALALGRLLIGTARDHPLAPALAGALIGFLVVGLFDSLVDAPRVALSFLVLLTVSLGLRAPPPPPVPALSRPSPSTQV